MALRPGRAESGLDLFILAALVSPESLYHILRSLGDAGEPAGFPGYILQNGRRISNNLR